MNPGLPPKLHEYASPETAGRYDARWASRAGRRRNRRKAAAVLRALDALSAAAGRELRSLLDVPCGTGRFTGLLHPRLDRYVGADLSLPMLRMVREKEREDPGLAPAGPVQLVAASLTRLPHRDASFDAAVCIRFLHLVRDPELRLAFLRELRRVARAGVVIDYRHGRTVRVWGRRLRHRLGLLPRPPANPSPAAIRAEVAAAGFAIVDWIPVHRAPGLSDKVLVAARPAPGPDEPVHAPGPPAD